MREVALAAVAGAASSSCSYASASVGRTMFKKGAALIPALAFVLASTNLVIELGVVLYLLMGWQFMAGEWVGGVVMIVVMAAIVGVTYPARLVEAARHHPEPGNAWARPRPWRGARGAGERLGAVGAAGDLGGGGAAFHHGLVDAVEGFAAGDF